eukprot:scaffold207_cov409-Prasinococcus_capsulatus_cf.AAC.106
MAVLRRCCPAAAVAPGIGSGCWALPYRRSDNGPQLSRLERGADNAKVAGSRHTPARERGARARWAIVPSNLFGNPVSTIHIPFALVSPPRRHLAPASIRTRRRRRQPVAPRSTTQRAAHRRVLALGSGCRCSTRRTKGMCEELRQLLSPIPLRDSFGGSGTSGPLRSVSRRQSGDRRGPASATARPQRLPPWSPSPTRKQSPSRLVRPLCERTLLAMRQKAATQSAS